MVNDPSNSSDCSPNSRQIITFGHQQSIEFTIVFGRQFIDPLMTGAIMVVNFCPNFWLFIILGLIFTGDSSLAVFLFRGCSLSFPMR